MHGKNERTCDRPGGMTTPPGTISNAKAMGDARLLPINCDRAHR